jgi:hypothetical protein
MARLHRTIPLFAALGLLWGATPEPAGAQEAPPLRFTTRAVQVTVGGRVQTLFSTTDVDRAIPALWELRRVRLDFNIVANDLVRARIQPELSGGQVGIRDAFVQLNLSPAAQVLVGQTFRPFSLLGQMSTARILPIERGARIRGLDPLPLEHYNLIGSLAYADRDIGLQLRGEPAGAPLGLTYAVGVFNGPLINAAGGRATYQLAARATARLAPDVRLGASWSRRDFGQAPTEDDPLIPLRSGMAWEADLELGNFTRGPHLMAEVVHGTFNPFVDAQRHFRAAQLWAAYRTAARGPAAFQWEPVARVSYGRPDATEGDRAAGRAGGVLLTPGLNFYLGPLNRIMLNYDLWNPHGGGREARSFKAMIQMAF